ncbi:MAG: aminoglycoside phosphotransferase family protein [bacterium]
MTVATITDASEREDTLRAIEYALDKNRMKAVFAAKLCQRFGKKLNINGFHLEVIQRHTYRCVLRYRIDAFDPDRAQEVQWRVIGKVLQADLGEIVFDNMRQLWMNGFSRLAVDGICIPEPIEFMRSISMLLQEEVPGLSAKVLLKQSAQQEHFRQLARALAKLHKCPIVPSRVFKVREHLLRCHPAHELLALSCPELAGSINDLVEQAYEIEAALGDIALVPVHADFHLGQVHLENGRAWLIDFDVLSYGDPATDLGNLLVFLKSKVRTHAGMGGMIQAFLEEYFSSMDPGIAARIPLYEGLSYLRRACKCLRLQEEGWREKAGQMVAQGVAALDLMASRCRLEDRRRAFIDEAVAELINAEVRDEVPRS